MLLRICSAMSMLWNSLFSFEGSRFYDLCRLARHKNASSPYGANFGGQWLARKLAYKNPVKDLTNENNWYLPFK